MTYRSIRVSWESWLYLRKMQHAQRAPHKPELSEASICRMKRNFECFNKCGLHDLCDGDLGGAEGERWVSWTVEEMAAMLDKAGLPYQYGQSERIRL